MKTAVRESVDAGMSDDFARIEKPAKSTKRALKLVKPTAPPVPLERLIVDTLFAHLASLGFAANVTVFDGEEVRKCATATEAADWVMKSSEALVMIGEPGKRHGIFIVPGNGADLIGNWSFNEMDADGFHAAMALFDETLIEVSAKAFA